METMPLSERLRRIRRDAPGGSPLREESLACFCEGVSLLAKIEYPKWLQKQIEAYYSIPVNTSFLRLVDHARNLAGEERCGDGYGCELMYQLLIEPFYLINEADKEEA